MVKHIKDCFVFFAEKNQKRLESMQNGSQKKEMKDENAGQTRKKKLVAVEWWKDLSSIATNSTVDTGLND